MSLKILVDGRKAYNIMLYGTSLRKYPNRFALSLIKNDRLQTSRAISIKPKQNYSFDMGQRIRLTYLSDTSGQVTLPKRPNTASKYRPSTAQIREDYEGVVLVSSPRKRPVSAVKKMSIKDLLRPNVF